MCWRSVKISRLSILNQLMLIYSFSILGIVLVIGLVFYPLFSYLIQVGDDPNLTIKCYLIISFLLFSILTTIFGYFVARSGLKKLETFTFQLREIKANSLHERLLLKEYPHELRLLGESFNEMMDRVERAFKQLSEFSSNIAHELRTPLHNLMHSTERLLSQNNLPAHCQLFLESNLEEYQHLARLIKQLLFLAKSENGQILLSKTPVSLREEIFHLTEYYQFLLEEKRINLTCKGDAKIEVDVTLFRQLINNLISNAINFTPEGGQIDIRVDVTKEWVIITIQDSGIGIPEEEIRCLFERFYRTDKSRTQSSGGLGLGLSIAKTIVDLHAGNIFIKSELGKGACVKIELPCALTKM